MRRTTLDPAYRGIFNIVVHAVAADLRRKLRGAGYAAEENGKREPAALGTGSELASQRRRRGQAGRRP